MTPADRDPCQRCGAGFGRSLRDTLTRGFDMSTERTLSVAFDKISALTSQKQTLRDALAATLDALRVATMDPITAAFLQGKDPKALAQLTSAAELAAKVLDETKGTV
jgi:hypothetical protein